MFNLLGKLVSRYWVLVILFWVVLAVGAQIVAPAWDDVTQDGDLKYLPARMTSVRGSQLLLDAFPESKAKGQLAWYHHQGPAGATFTQKTIDVEESGEFTTTVSFSQPGEYVLRVTALEHLGALMQHCCWTNGYVEVAVTP